jgi:hypothetical protein
VTSGPPRSRMTVRFFYFARGEGNFFGSTEDRPAQSIISWSLRSKSLSLAVDARASQTCRYLKAVPGPSGMTATASTNCADNAGRAYQRKTARLVEAGKKRLWREIPRQGIFRHANRELFMNYIVLVDCFEMAVKAKAAADGRGRQGIVAVAAGATDRGSGRRVN